MFEAIRWSYLTHEELVEVSMEKEFELAKSLILEGLSCRLINFEQTQKMGKLVNNKPRVHYSNNVLNSGDRFGD